MASSERERETFQFAPVLNTERLTLTLYDNNDDEDVDLFLRVFEDPAVREHAGDFGIKTRNDMRRLADSTTLGHRLLGGKKAAGAAIYIVRLGPNNLNGERIGHVELPQRNAEMFPDVGYAVFSQYAGRGYATEATKEAVRYWREECGIRDMQVFTDPGNRASFRVAEKLGFERQSDGEAGESVGGKGSSMRIYMTPGSVQPRTDKRFTLFGDGSQFRD